MGCPATVLSECSLDIAMICQNIKGNILQLVTSLH